MVENEMGRHQDKLREAYVLAPVRGYRIDIWNQEWENLSACVNPDTSIYTEACLTIWIC